MQDLIKALAKARAEFAEVAKDKTNPHYRNRYASLDAILKAVSPALSDNGLAITQVGVATEQGQALKTILWHTSGQCLESVMALPSVADMQKLGSALTYARRYSISALLNISADEDDDGNSADSKPDANNAKPKAQSNGAGLISDAQKKRLFAIANEHGWETEAAKAMLAKMGFESTSKVTKAKYEEVCINLQNAELAKSWNDFIKQGVAQ